MCQGECFFVEAELGLTAAKKRPDSFRFVLRGIVVGGTRTIGVYTLIFS